MASLSLRSTILLSLCLVLLSNTHAIPSQQLAGANDFQGCPKNMTNFRFYSQSVYSGKNVNFLQVAGPTLTNPLEPGFGVVTVSDLPLTDKADEKSTSLGRLQGMYVSAGQKEKAALFLANFIFYATNGPNARNASSLAVHGRLTDTVDLNEIPVVGSSGEFHGPRKILFAQKKSQDKNSIFVEYNLCCDKNPKKKH